MNNNDIVLIENIVTSKLDQSIILIIGRKFEKTVDFFNLPCTSQLLNMYVASNLSYLQSWKLTDIAEKMICFPLFNCETKSIVMLLLHLQ